MTLLLCLSSWSCPWSRRWPEPDVFCTHMTQICSILTIWTPQTTQIWYFSLLIRVAFICVSYISCIQNTWPFHRSPECFATSLVGEMLTCIGKGDLSIHEILVSVKSFVSKWNRSWLQLRIHTQLYMGEACKFKLTLFILFNLNQLTNETVNAGFA